MGLRTERNERREIDEGAHVWNRTMPRPKSVPSSSSEVPSNFSGISSVQFVVITPCGVPLREPPDRSDRSTGGESAMSIEGSVCFLGTAAGRFCQWNSWLVCRSNDFRHFHRNGRVVACRAIRMIRGIRSIRMNLRRCGRPRSSHNRSLLYPALSLGMERGADLASVELAAAP